MILEYAIARPQVLLMEDGELPKLSCHGLRESNEMGNKAHEVHLSRHEGFSHGINASGYQQLVEWRHFYLFIYRYYKVARALNVTSCRSKEALDRATSCCYQNAHVTHVYPSLTPCATS